MERLDIQRHVRHGWLSGFKLERDFQILAIFELTQLTLARERGIPWIQ